MTHLMGQYSYELDKTHPRANSEGQVYQHILIAEKILQRRLKPGETVHHKDLDKRDNNPSNLIVFSTKGDHTRFHAYGCNENDLILTEDGSYTVDQKKKETVCENCGGKFVQKRSGKHKFCSPQCAIMGARTDRGAKYVDIPDKASIQEKLKTQTKTALAEEFGVSRTTINRWLSR